MFVARLQEDVSLKFAEGWRVRKDFAPCRYHAYKSTTGWSSVMTRLIDLVSLPEQNCSMFQEWPTPLALTRSNICTRV